MAEEKFSLGRAYSKPRQEMIKEVFAATRAIAEPLIAKFTEDCQYTPDQILLLGMYLTSMAAAQSRSQQALCEVTLDVSRLFSEYVNTVLEEAKALGQTDENKFLVFSPPRQVTVIGDAEIMKQLGNQVDSIDLKGPSTIQ